MEGTDFAGKTFDEHADCHSTWEGVRIDDDVRLHSRFRKWHIDSRPFL
jgi:hypothetical protein